MNMPERTTLRGEAVAPGRERAQAFVFKPLDLEAVARTPLNVENRQVEAMRFDTAVATAIEQIRQDTLQMRGDNANLITIQTLCLGDSGSIDSIRQAILSNGHNAEYAVAHTLSRIRHSFEAITDQRIGSRILDIQDAYHRVLRILLGIEHVRANALRRIVKPVIVVGDELTPTDLLQVDRTLLRGIIIQNAGMATHVAALAQSLGIPMVARCSRALNAIHSGNELLIDGALGLVIINPQPADTSIVEADSADSHSPACINDKSGCARQIKLEATIGSFSEAQTALQKGVDGIGLLRSELFYMQHGQIPLPSVERAFYRSIIETMHPAAVTIRLLDGGQDKILPGLSLSNATAARGMRLLLDNKELLMAHVRSVIGASPFGRIRLLLPFVATYRELRAALAAIADASALEEIKRSDLTIGLMVETPAIAEALDSYLEGIDFISIGSGDLSSYIIGAKRGSNEYEHGLQTQRTRILDTINTITETAHRRHLDVTVCGVLGARPDYLKSLIDMAIDSVSVPVSEVDNVDGVIRSREVVIDG